MSDSLRNQDQIRIPIYYKYKYGKYGFKKVIPLKDEEAEPLLKDEEKKKEVNIINTVWKTLDWKEQNSFFTQCSETNPMNGEKIVNFQKYRDLKIKMCLKDWDYSENNQKVNVVPEVIDTMNPDIVYEMFRKYEDATNLPTEERGN